MLRECYGHTLESALNGYVLELIKKVYVAQMDSVKESYRSGVSVYLRVGYGHRIFVSDCKSSEDTRGKGIFCSKTLHIRVNGVLLHPNEVVGHGPVILSTGF